MASITRDSSGRWRARYRDNDRKQHSKRFDRKIDAQRWLDQATTELTTGTWTDPRRAARDVAVWVQSCLDSKIDLAASSRARSQQVIDKYVRPKWAGVELGRLEHSKVQAWVAELSDAGLSPRSVRKVVGTLSSACDAAIRDRRLSINPCSGVSFPKANPVEKVFLTAEQVEDLAGESGRHGEVIVYTLAYCGLRWGELAGLRVQDVDPLRKRLNIRQTIVVVGTEVVVKPPKDHEARSVPVPSFLMELLQDKIASRDQDDLVFTSPRGAVLRGRNERRRWFDQAAAEIGEPGLTPHGLRHTAASIAINNGASVLAVQRMLGHSSATVTLDVYSDLFDSDLDALGARLDAVQRDAAESFASKVRPIA
ncbi:integrase [Brevibacterium epidermidis]|jgi:integrase|uniref:Integrase n=1 Tax=Brevibacterium epidermidis TaxID=1698 RepID=A0ABV4EQ98_BREEP